MASRTTAHGRVLPAFLESATAMDNASVPAPFQASGRDVGKRSSGEMGSGGAWRTASPATNVGDTSSLRRLAGPEVSQRCPSRTAARIVSSTTAAATAGTGIGSS
jgi:hypothetical protein